MKKDLLLEIGTEEIPARFIPRALKSFESILSKNLQGARFDFKGITTFGTPRRLALIVKGLEDTQPDARVEQRGPQTRAAYDAQGNPTNALIGFARSQGVEVGDLKTVKTDKGEYVYAVKDVKGEPASKILPGILKDTISQEIFPKSMRWGAHDITFARPIHWIAALYDGTEVEFELGHIKSSRTTLGHRFLTADKKTKRPKSVSILNAGAYLKQLKKAWVIADPEERKAIISEGLHTAARDAGGAVVPDEGLLEEVTYLCEYPLVVRGSFGEEFLGLPRDVVINTMREHQRFFSVIDSQGGLLPYFLTVANTKAADMEVVRKGNERVLRARLNDAKFYFDKDIKVRLVDRVDALKGVVFQAKLGTSYGKVERFTGLALFIGSELGFSKPLEAGEKPSDFATESFNPAAYDPKNTDPGFYSKLVVGRAAILSKADLTSGMVGEFPTLQGVMGSTYAARNGEAPEVAAAIYEHYLPATSGGALPVSVPGAIVSIADKVDTITGCFAVGLIPTGAQDPYALRRQALGVIAIVLDKAFTLRLDAIVDKAIELLGDKLAAPAATVKESVLDFFKERLRNQLLAQGLSYDSIDAVLSAPWYEVLDSVKRIKALEGFKKNPNCPGLVTAFKRVSNILKGFEAGAAAPQPAIFIDDEEKALYNACLEIGPVMDAFWKKGEYESVLETLSSIKGRIDSFFDKVMVMAEDENVRRNRLLLLNAVRGLYFRLADLSKLSV